MDKYTKHDVRSKIANEEDYIKSPKYNNSVKRLVNENPDGISNAEIAKYLLTTEAEVVKLYDQAVEKIRKQMKE